MIKLRGSRFTDILPDNLAGNLEVRAFAHAVGRQIEKICDYSDAARTYAAIAALPDRVLDILAVELRTPSYSEDFSTRVKRALIMESLTFYMKMGTPSAVNKIIKTIFEEGHIKEWFEYGREPHHFKAYTTNPAITEADIDEFRQVLDTVKRLSSWLDEIILALTTPAMELYIGHWLHTGEFITLKRATL